MRVDREQPASDHRIAGISSVKMVLSMGRNHYSGADRSKRYANLFLNRINRLGGTSYEASYPVFISYIKMSYLTHMPIVFPQKSRLCHTTHRQPPWGTLHAPPTLAPCRVVVDRPDIEADIRYRRYKLNDAMQPCYLKLARCM